MTNYEKYKSMSIEELTEKITDKILCIDCPCFKKCIKTNVVKFSPECKAFIKKHLESEAEKDG